jgi:drug/metabolite transporter (DMT)-like permease
MKHALRLLTGLALLVAGVLLTLWGAFFFLYRGDEGSSTVYIGDVDAQVVGVMALAVGLAAIWVSSRLLRRWPRRFANRDADLS